MERLRHRHPILRRRVVGGVGALRRRLRQDGGTTLPEILVTIVVMGTAVVALLGGLGVAVQTSDRNQTRASADLVLRNYAEHVKNVVAVQCRTSPTFPSVAVALPSGYQVNAPSQFDQTGAAVPYGTCPAATTSHSLTLTAQTPGQRGDMTLDFRVVAP